jgi:hypothetical protein
MPSQGIFDPLRAGHMAGSAAAHSHNMFTGWLAAEHVVK